MSGLVQPTEVVVNGVAAPFAEGVVRVGGLDLAIVAADLEGGRRLDVVVRNPGDGEVRLDDIVIRLGRAKPEQLLEHGYQSWSVVRRCRADDVRPERIELPDWARGTHLSRPDAAGQVISGDQFLVTSDGVVGFLGGRSHFGTVEADAGGTGIDVRALFDGVPLDGGGERILEPIWLAEGDAGVRYSDFASLWGILAGGRVTARAPVGWCSWYQYFAEVTPDDVRANFEAAAGRGFDLVQIDDGYQAAIGDWLDVRPAWKDALEPLAMEIRHHGMQAGIWTAPFLAGEDSAVLRDHPDWVTRHTSGHPSKAMYNPDSWGGWAYALDTTRPDVLDHLRSTYATLVARGFDYHKIDFCYSAALPAQRHDRTMTRAEALRAGLDAVRDGIGDDAFLLGCGCPFGPAVGVVDGMRVSADVAPTWSPSDVHWPGMAESAPAAVNAIAASVLRAPLHRRVFINDPDCLLLRPTDTQLEAWQRSFLAAVIIGTGAFTLLSDDLRRYTDAEWGLVEAITSVRHDVDTLLDIDDPFAWPLVVRSAAGTSLTVDWRADAPGGPIAQLGAVE